eukprot:TRINITY_DN21874_c0_g1_i1.p1 TRINITY_DN21874_c0_g1~~TRINITY_DN21874_c0_g1_i1.p1  ORF type:complete len:389 (-),score=115.59 TRINITY_DN21874_c0_g1_i1:284-1450(-)
MDSVHNTYFLGNMIDELLRKRRFEEAASALDDLFPRFQDLSSSIRSRLCSLLWQLPGGQAAVRRFLAGQTSGRIGYVETWILEELLWIQSIDSGLGALENVGFVQARLENLREKGSGDKDALERLLPVVDSFVCLLKGKTLFSDSMEGSENDLPALSSISKVVQESDGNDEIACFLFLLGEYQLITPKECVSWLAEFCRAYPWNPNSRRMLLQFESRHAEARVETSCEGALHVLSLDPVDESALGVLLRDAEEDGDVESAMEAIAVAIDYDKDHIFSWVKGSTFLIRHREKLDDWACSQRSERLWWRYERLSSDCDRSRWSASEFFGVALSKCVWSLLVFRDVFGYCSHLLKWVEYKAGEEDFKDAALGMIKNHDFARVLQLLEWRSD